MMMTAQPTHSYRWRGESHRANQVDAPPQQLQERERDIDPIKSMRSHTPATGGEERVKSQSSGMLSPHQLQVERRET